MAEAFDPYREWLGIRETARPLSHYQLLGVTEFEENALAIVVAADSAISRLKGTDPRDRRGRWQQLQDELSLARLCLSDRTRKMQYDAQLRARRGMVSAPVSEPASAAPVAQPTAPVASRATNADMLPPSVERSAAPLAVPAPQMVAPSYPVQQQYTFGQPIYIAIPANHPVGMPIGIPTSYPVPNYGAPQVPFVAPSAPYVPQARPVEARPVETSVPLDVIVGPPSAPIDVPGSDAPSSSSAVATVDAESGLHSAPINPRTAAAPNAIGFDFPDATGPRGASRAIWSPDAKSMGIFAGVALTALLGFVVVRSMAPKEPKPIAQRDTTSQPTVIPAVTPLQPTEPKQRPEPSRPKLIDDSDAPSPPKPQSKPPAPKKPGPQTVAQVDEPMPEGEPQPAPPPQGQTPEQKALFEKSLKNARTAMGARKLPLAQEELKTAKANIGTAEQETEAARMEELYGYVEGFWKAVVESLKGLQATDTIPIDNTEIAIVEIDDSSITIRAAGRNMSYTLQEMPAGLALALATRWFDMKMPANKLFVGAFHAVDPAGDLDDARRLWETATREGASAASLMPLLDERTAPLATEQGPVPQKALIAKARQALKASMTNEYRAAKSLERKLSLAREILDMAAQNDNAVERYVLYDEALNLATDAGSAPDILAAIEGLAAAYKVDAWGLRATAFTSAAASADNPVIAKALARELIEVVDQAITEEHPKEAAKLCNAALSAAKKGKDLELVKQATERKAKLGES